MAVTTGLTVGGNYVNQPLLDTIAGDLGIGDGRAAALVTVAQVSYGLGLLLVVPLGDLLERRRLLVALALLAAAGHAVCALATSYPLLVLGTAVAGLFSVAAQILVPFAAELAAPGREGRAVGTVMSGLLVGALLARSVSGALASFAGWHAPYAVVAVALVLVSVVLGRRLPRSEPTAAGGYLATLRSAAALVRELPRLRTRALLGGLGFAGVSVLFATTTFLLTGPRFGLSELQVGLVGLAGVAGASMASVAGRLADAGRGQWATGIGAVGLIATWGLLGLSSSVWLTSTLLFVLGFGLADMFLQAVHVSNQNVVYPLRPDARSRLNSVYMTTYFAGGALGSAAGSAAWSAGGWPVVTAVGAGLGVLVLLVWFVDLRLERSLSLAGAGSR
nr:MFS transporter [Kineococcus aurantiacus]